MELSELSVRPQHNTNCRRESERGQAVLTGLALSHSDCETVGKTCSRAAASLNAGNMDVFGFKMAFGSSCLGNVSRHRWNMLIFHRWSHVPVLAVPIQRPSHIKLMYVSLTYREKTHNTP